MSYMEPRGIRNCNPGNIRITKDKWKGLREVQTDGEFFQFVSMAYGYRALIRTLQNYRRLHDCWTIGDFIRRWAPSTENSGGVPGNQQPSYNYPIYIPTVEDEPEGEKVTAPNTFDGGIASAVVVTILSATGGAWLAKKKD